MPLFYKIAYLLCLNYWYFFRPHYRGVHCLITCRSQTLLIRHTYGLDYWEVPGGGLHPGESALSAIAREVKEEAGLTPTKFVGIGKYTTIHEYKIDAIDAYWVTVPNLNFTLTSAEILEAKWFPLKKLPSHLSPHVQNILKLYQIR